MTDREVDLAELVLEWAASVLFVVLVTALLLAPLIWLMGDIFKGIAVYLMLWVMLWDRRHVAKVMREAEIIEPPKPLDPPADS